MSRLFNKLNLIPFFDAPDAGKGGSATAELTKDDILSYLSEDDKDDKDVINLDEKPNKEDKKEKEVPPVDKEDEDKDKESEDEDDELKALEEDLEDDVEPDDEKLELTTPVPRREILKKYPQLFKEFPYLEKAYYREQQYTQLLPTIDDAKKAVNDSQTLNNIEKELTAGNISNLLLAVKNESESSFNDIVNNYLGTLEKLDKGAYHHVIGNVIKYTVMSMVEEARASDNDALQGAASLLHQFIFGSSKFTAPGKFGNPNAPKQDDKQTEIQRERDSYLQEKFNDARDSLNSKVNNVIKATIDQHIDPKSSMTAFVKTSAVRNAVESVTDLISKDARFKVLVDRLWDNAAKNRFSKESTDKIRQAFVSKARTLLPTVIKSARNDALKGMGKRVRDDSDERDTTTKESSNKVRSSRPEVHERTSSRGKEKVPAGMSSLEFLMSED